MADELAEFDPLLHSPARLKIMMLLAATQTGVFNDLARDANLTAGNLATHVKHLENAGYVETFRTFIELKPRVRYRLTTRGRDALRAYVKALEKAIENIQKLVPE